MVETKFRFAKEEDSLLVLGFIKELASRHVIDHKVKQEKMTK